MAAAEEAVRRATKILSAFMSQIEVQNYSAQTLDPGALLSAWGAQQGNVTALTDKYAPPKLEPLSVKAQQHAAQLKANPIFQNQYGAGAEIKMIELGRLIAFQWHVDHVVSNDVHGASLTATPGEDEILSTCLPLSMVTGVRTLWQVMQRGPGMASGGVVASSTDLTFDLAPGFPQANAATGQIGIVLSPNSNLMMVRQNGDRFALANGYHRAAALRARGIAMAPVVVVQAPVLGQGAGFFSEPLLLGERPPLVDDFANDTLATTVEVRAMMKVVRVTIESLLVPRMI
jgi:hypothetical protein